MFVDLLGIILNESCWKEKSNQTALVFLLSVAFATAAHPQVYLAKDVSLFLKDNRVQTLFSLFRLLCISKASRVDGLKLLTAMITSLPREAIQPNLPVVVDILVIISAVGLHIHHSRLARLARRQGVHPARAGRCSPCSTAWRRPPRWWRRRVPKPSPRCSPRCSPTAWRTPPSSRSKIKIVAPAAC